MVVDANVDPMSELEEDMKPKPRSGEFTPFFFKIKPGQKALIRPLLNMTEYVRAWKHEYYHKPSETWKFRNVCVTDDGLECQCCKDVAAMPASTKEEKKAQRDASRSKRIVLPVYLLMMVTTETGQFVTYTQDDKELPVSGPRLLEMKPEYSTILHDLMQAWQHPAGGHDITKYDFKIECTLGEDKFPKYVTTPKDLDSSKTLDIPAEYLSKGKVLDLYYEACPPKIVGQTEAPTAAPAQSAANGKVRTAPDF